MLELLQTRTVRNMSLLTAVNFLSGILRFLCTILLAKILAPEDWGNVAIFISILDVVFILADAGLNATLVRFVAAHPDKRASSVVGRCLGLRILLSAGLFLGLWAFQGPILANQHFPPELHWVYLFSVFSAIALAFHTMSLSIFQAKEEYGRYSVSFISVNLIRVSSLALFALLGKGTLNALILLYFSAPFIGLLLVFPFAAASVRRTASLPPASVKTREIVLFMLPLAAMNAITIGHMRVSSFMLKMLATPEAVANYELAYQIGFALPLVTRAMITVLLPRVSTMKTGDELLRYRGRVLRLYFVILPLTLAGVLLAPLFISLVFGEKYVESLNIIRLLLVAFGLSVLMPPLGLVFYAMKRPIYLTGVQLLQLVITVALNYYFIPRWEGIGAAVVMLIGTLVSAFAIITLSSWVIRRIPEPDPA